MNDFIGKIKDSIRVLTGKEPSYMLRNLKMEEGIIIGDTHIYVSNSHLSSHIAVRIFTPKDNKIVFLDKDGNPKKHDKEGLRGHKQQLIMFDDSWNNK